MPSGCAYYTDPKSPEYNRIVFDTGADTHNNESNVKNSNCDSGWCLNSASYRVCKNADNKYKILDSPKDNCSDNLFMVVGINHSYGNDGKFFNYDVDAANKALQSLYDYSYDEYEKKDAIVNDKVYSVYHHRTNEVIKVYLWTSPNSKGNYTGGITNKGHGRRIDSKVVFKPGDYLSFVNNVSILSKGSPTDNMSEKECKAWADARPDKAWRESGTWDHFAKGCSVHNKDNDVWYNRKNTGLKCGKDSTRDKDHQCVSKDKGVFAYPQIYTGNFEERDSGRAAQNVSIGAIFVLSEPEYCTAIFICIRVIKNPIGGI